MTLIIPTLTFESYIRDEKEPLDLIVEEVFKIDPISADVLSSIIEFSKMKPQEKIRRRMKYNDDIRWYGGMDCDIADKVYNKEIIWLSEDFSVTKKEAKDLYQKAIDIVTDMVPGYPFYNQVIDWYEKKTGTKVDRKYHY